jgi:polyisoprenoid-binding protein YceI
MTWQLDSSHSHIGFAVKHLMVATVRGEFGSYTGTLQLDTDDLTKSHVTAEIDASSISTRDEKRDEHLRSADFFDVANHPKITFKSTRIESAGGQNFKLIGDLTIRGTTKEVTLDAEYSGIAKDPWGNTKSGFEITGAINRSDFGLTFNAALETGGVLVGEKVKLQIEVEVLQVAPVAV